MTDTDMSDDELAAAWAAGELRVIEAAPEDHALFMQYLEEEDEKNRNCLHESIDDTAETYPVDRQGRTRRLAVCEDCGLVLGDLGWGSGVL